MKRKLIPLLAAVTVQLSQPVWAHGGEDHGDAPPAVAQVGQAPRVAADTDEFELVAVLTGVGGQAQGDGSAQAAPVLTLYLDRFATNEPVANATVEVESGAFKSVATAQSPGVYTVAGNAFSKPGRYPLTVSVQTADGADLLDAALEYGPSAAGASRAQPTTYRRWYWGIAGGLLVAALAVWLGRRGRRR